MGLINDTIKKYIIDEAPKDDKPSYEEELITKVQPVPSAFEMWEKSCSVEATRQFEYMDDKLRKLDDCLIDLYSDTKYRTEYKRKELRFEVWNNDYTPPVVVDSLTYDFAEKLQKYKDLKYSVTVEEVICYTGSLCTRNIVLDWNNSEKQYARILIYPENEKFMYLKTFADLIHYRFPMYEYYNKEKTILICPLWDDVPMRMTENEGLI